MVRWLMVGCAVLCLAAAAAARQDSVPSPARQLEDLAWAKYGGRDARPNRWPELVELFEELDRRRDAARRRVSAEVLGEPEEDYAGIDVGYDFWMVGTEAQHMRFAAEDDEDDWLRTGFGETPEEIRENFRAAEAVYIEMLDAMDADGLIGRLQALRDSGDAFVRPMPPGATATDAGAMVESMGDFRRLAQMLGRRLHLAAERGAWDRYLDDLSTVCWLGDIAQGRGPMIR